MQNIVGIDHLTGLFNRQKLNELSEEIIKHNCNDKTELSCVMMDIDDFKQINDTKGHKYGDDILIKIAGILEKEKPVEGFVYRFGGDEFVVFYPNCDERITENFITAVSLELKKSNVSLSHGIIVTDPASGKSLDEYIVMADKEMYKIKQARKAK